LEEFSKINSFGVPMKVMKAFLDMRPEEKDKPQNKLGIPFNSPGNEFKNWVATARTVAGKEMKITIKGDQSASYPAIKKIIGTLRDLNEDKFNLITEQPTGLEQPKAIEQPKFIKPPMEQIKIRASRAVTIILDKDNSVYYYVGARDTKTGIDPVITKTDFSSSGIHKFLINKNYDVVAKIEDLKKKKQELNLSEEAFEQQRKEIISDKNALVVLIKSTDDANYGNLINILDEMALCSIGRFAIVDISGYDKNLMKKAKIELNPPAFQLKTRSRV
jgi:biopolymer transport protein ExbD